MISQTLSQNMPYKIIFQSVASVCFLCLFPASFLAATAADLSPTIKPICECSSEYVSKWPKWQGIDRSLPLWTHNPAMWRCHDETQNENNMPTTREMCARQPVRELSKGRYKTTHIKNQPGRQPRKRVWGKIINFLKGFLTDGVTG